MTARSSEATGQRLVVDPLACDGIGLCAHLAPGVVDLDRWGFPVVPREDLSRRDERLAERAARGCPRKALAVTDRSDRRG